MLPKSRPLKVVQSRASALLAPSRESARVWVFTHDCVQYNTCEGAGIVIMRYVQAVAASHDVHLYMCGDTTHQLIERGGGGRGARHTVTSWFCSKSTVERQVSNAVTSCWSTH
jgi:hypothetical protein